MNGANRSTLPAAIAMLLASCGSSGVDLDLVCNRPGSYSSETFSGREYILYVPTTFQKQSSALVIALHPLGASGSQMSGLTCLEAKAEKASFAVAYPSASGTLDGIPSWTKFYQSGPDDIGYLREMIGRIQSKIQFDPKKVYVTGYSDGAAMTHRVGVELGDLVAGIAPVEGTLFYSFGRTVQQGLEAIPSAVAPVSVLIIHGDVDREDSIPYCDDYAGIGMATQEMGFNYWAGATANDCRTSSSSMPLCGGSAITALTTKTASDCRNGVEVRIYRVRSARHGFWNKAPAWSTRLDDPNKQPYAPDWDAASGTTTNDVLWNFFATHPKP